MQNMDGTDMKASDNESNNNLEANDVNIDTETDIKDENQEQTYKLISIANH